MRSSAIIIYVFSSFGFRTQRIRATFAPFVAPLQVVCCLGQTLDAEMRAQRASSPIKVVYDIDTSGDRNLWHLDNMLLGYHSNVLAHCTEFRNFFVCGFMCPCPFCPLAERELDSSEPNCICVRRTKEALVSASIRMCWFRNEFLFHVGVS